MLSNMFEDTGAYRVRVIDSEAEEINELRSFIDEEEWEEFDAMVEDGAELDQLREYFDY